MKWAVSSYSFSGAVRDGRLMPEQLPEKAAAMGFDGIEFTDLPVDGAFDGQAAWAEALRERAAAASVTVVAYTVGANLFTGTAEGDRREIERLKAQVDIAERLGAPIMRHDTFWRLMPEICAGRSFDGMLAATAAGIREVAAYAAEKGVRTCTENHGYIAQDSDRMERLFNAVNHRNYGLLVDIGNFLCVDEDPVRAVSRLAPYAVHVHAKDMRRLPFGVPESAGGFPTRGGNQLHGVALGDGDVPVRQCLAVLRQAGYDGWVSLEYEGLGDCLDGICKGLQFLRGITGETAG